MNVAIIDVGSNSIRLLVADVADGRVEQLHRERIYMRLGDDAFRLGRIGPRKLRDTRDVARSFARVAKKCGAKRLETIVTAPGRQASNHEELVDVLSESTRAPVVVLSADEEGRLAWHGAVARMESPPEIVAVVDIGGGSCELAVGTPLRGPTWVRSLEAGSLRVTRAYLSSDRPDARLGDPPPAKLLASARREIRLLTDDLDPPRPDVAIAVGGTARALGRVVGRRFGIDDLEELVATLSTVPAESVTKSHGVTPERAETLLGGTLVLAEIARRLDSKLEVGRGGLREGAALALARTEAAAA